MVNASGMFLGLDLGTSSCKAVLVDISGRVVRSASAAYQTASPQPGWAEQGPADWLAAVATAVRQLEIAGGEVAGVALTSAAHIGVLLGGDGRPLRPAILWNDQRTVAEVAELEAAAGEMILNASCQAVSTGWTLPHLVWVRRHEPRAWKQVQAIMLSKDYLLHWLTGRAVTDPATAVSSQLYDFRGQSWSCELCALAGVRPEMLPEVLPATGVVGGLLAPAAAALGLKPGTPVVNGTLDSATELLAAGICRPGAAQVRLATAGGVQMVVPGPLPDRRRITYPHAVAPFWYCQAGTSTCAAAVRWAMVTLGAGEPAAASCAAWDAEARAVPPGCDGLLFHPYLAGERAPHWDPRLRGSFSGLGLNHGRGHLARAVYEGTAYSIRQAMGVLPGVVVAAASEPLAVVGGGSRSTLWCEVLANVLGVPLRPLPDADSATGAALLGLAGLGLAAGLEELAGGRERDCAMIRPEPALMGLYAASFADYIDLHARLAPHYHQRGVQPAAKGKN